MSVDAMIVLVPWLTALFAGLSIVLEDRRVILGVLAVEYVLVFWYANIGLPTIIAMVYSIGGLLACGALWLTYRSVGDSAPAAQFTAVPSGRVFRILAVLLVAISAYGVTAQGWLPAEEFAGHQVLGALLLLGLGLLNLGISEEPFRVAVGLLTILAGFEIIYSMLEKSLAVIALVASIPLGIAIVVSFILVNARLLQGGSD